MPLICDGCGQRVPIPSGYRRNKIQCGCGVICSVPESERTQEAEPTPQKQRAAASAPPVVEEQAERWLLDDEPATSQAAEAPPTFRVPDPIEETSPKHEPTVAERRFPCRHCGRLIRRQRECPDCHPEAVAHAVGEEPVWWPSVDEPDKKQEEDEEASPYGVVGADEVPCPKCSLRLPPGSVLCVRCGFHLKRRKKIAKSYQPIERVWETNASYAKRLSIFVVCIGALFVVGLIGVSQGEAPLSVFLFGFGIVAAMLAFLLGTFDSIHLTRDARGKVQLTKTWRAAFYARQPQTIDVRGYEGIVSGRHREIGAWEYLICFMLLGFGIIPGIVWWYFIIHKVTFHVSLSRDHGFPAYLVYSGWQEIQMKEIAYTLRDATGLHYNEG